MMKSCTIASCGTSTTPACSTAPSAPMRYSARRAPKGRAPKFHTLPSWSIFGWAENGIDLRSSRQVRMPIVSSVTGFSSIAEPPSHSAYRRPPNGSRLVLAAFIVSLLLIPRRETWVPKAGYRNWPACDSSMNFWVATNLPRWLTRPWPICQRWAKPSPSNQWWQRSPPSSNRPGPLRKKTPSRSAGMRPLMVASPARSPTVSANTARVGSRSSAA